MVITGQVVAWIDKCEQNIAKIQQSDAVTKEAIARQYAILATLINVVNDTAYLSGTQYQFPKK